MRRLLVAFALLAAACAGDTATTTTSAEQDAPTTSPTTQPPATTTAPAPPTTRARPPTTTARPALDPVIVESGFWTQGNLDRGGWVAIVENPNSDWLLTNVFFDITVLDATDRVIDTTFESAEFILPGGQVAISGSVFDPPAAIAALEFEASWDTQDVRGQALGTFAHNDVTVSTERSRTMWSGDAITTFESDFEFVSLYVILRDAAGNIVGAETDFIDLLAGRATFFEVTYFDAPAYDSYEIYFTP